MHSLQCCSKCMHGCKTGPNDDNALSGDLSSLRLPQCLSSLCESSHRADVMPAKQQYWYARQPGYSGGLTDGLRVCQPELDTSHVNDHVVQVPADRICQSREVLKWGQPDMSDPDKPQITQLLH